MARTGTNIVLALTLLAGAGQASASSNLSLTLLAECSGTKGESIAAGAIFGKIAIGAVVDWAGAMIKAQSETKSASLGEGTMEGRFYQLDSDGKLGRAYSCLRLVSWSQDAGAPTSEGGKKALSHLRETPEFANLTKEPDLAIDFKLTGPKDMSGVFTLRPVFMYFGRSGISGWTNNKRSIAIALTFINPSDIEKPFATASFKFEQIPIGAYIDKASNPLIAEQSSGWMPAPPFTAAEAISVAAAAAYVASEQSNTDAAADQELLASDSSLTMAPLNKELADELGAYCNLLQSDPKGSKNAAADPQFCPVATFEREQQIQQRKARALRAKIAYIDHPIKQATITPTMLGLMNVTAKIVETRDPSAFWAAVSGAFDAQKADLNSALARKFIPSERKAAEKTQHDEDVTAANALDENKVLFEDAKLKVVEKQQEVDKLTDKATKLEIAAAKAELVKAKLRANTAARNSGQALPYPDLG